MKIEIKEITSWNDVVNAARFTVRKEAIQGEPSDKFKVDMIRSEHSPLRMLLFDVYMYDIPYWVAMHFRTHVRASIENAYISTSRPDRTDTALSNDEIPRSVPVNALFRINAQGILNISRLRLCRKASKETREVWRQVLLQLHKTEPLLAAACDEQCVRLGYCPEFSSCGYANTESFRTMRCSLLRFLNFHDAPQP